MQSKHQSFILLILDLLHSCCVGAVQQRWKPGQWRLIFLKHGLLMRFIKALLTAVRSRLLVAIRKSAQPVKEIKKFEILKPIAEGEKALRIGSGGVVCLANDLLPVDAKNWYIPVGLL